MKAMEIWNALQRSDECNEAYDFYERLYNASGDGMQKLYSNIDKYVRHHVLERGAANFDQRTRPYPMAEKSYYKVEAYVRYSMRMHLKQNLALFKSRNLFLNHLSDSQRIFFVDFGCGPMTAGVALHEIISTSPDFKDKTIIYNGVDVSQRMCDKANEINRQHRLFEKENFFISRAPHLSLDLRDNSSYHKCDTVVGVCSFVLASSTFRGEGMRQLWRNWTALVEDQFACRHFLLLYLNPQTTQSESGFGRNWRDLCKFFLANKSVFEYTKSNEQPLIWDGDREVSVSSILGRHRGLSKQPQ